MKPGSHRVPKLSETLLKSIQERLTDSRVYIHFTKEKSVANSICMHGFRYSDCFEKTTAEVSASKIDVKYKFQLYRDYGNYLIVICIPRSRFVNFKSSEMNSRQDSLCSIGLSEHHPEENLEYTLSPEYVYAYIDLINQKIHNNKLYLKQI